MRGRSANKWIGKAIPTTVCCSIVKMAAQWLVEVGCSVSVSVYLYARTPQGGLLSSPRRVIKVYSGEEGLHSCNSNDGWRQNHRRGRSHNKVEFIRGELQISPTNCTIEFTVFGVNRSGVYVRWIWEKEPLKVRVLLTQDLQMFLNGLQRSHQCSHHQCIFADRVLDGMCYFLLFITWNGGKRLQKHKLSKKDFLHTEIESSTYEFNTGIDYS